MSCGLVMRGGGVISTNDEAPDPPKAQRSGQRGPWVTVVVGLLALALGVGVGFVAVGGADSNAEQGAFPTGRFVNENNPHRAYVFRADGTYSYTESGYTRGESDAAEAYEVEVTGIYAVRGDLFTEMTHDYAYDRKIPATYRWTFDGTNLTFELVGETSSTNEWTP
jgi:hypothetical protein